jgi:hypothetical protein
MRGGTPKPRMHDLPVDLLARLDSWAVAAVSGAEQGRSYRNAGRDRHAAER